MSVVPLAYSKLVQQFTSYSTLTRTLSWAGMTANSITISRLNARRERDRAFSPDRRVEQLRNRITLPAKPVEVWFEQVPIGAPGGIGPTDYRLIAVLRFARDDVARIIRAAQPREGSPRILNSFRRSWLPEPVQSAIQPNDERSVAIPGQKFDAAQFTKSPFLSGTFIAVEGGEYIVLLVGTS